MNGKIFKGKLKNDEMEGYGIIYFPNGDKYEGYIVKWKKEGYGIYYYSNGNKFKGEFKNDKKEGYGIFYYSNRNKFEGRWKNNKKEGYGIHYYLNEKKYEYEFYNNKDDKCEGDLSSPGLKNEEYFKSKIIDYPNYKTLTFSEYLNSIFMKRKITMLLIIILIFGLLIN